jgi:hypothetical protein
LFFTFIFGTASVTMSCSLNVSLTLFVCLILLLTQADATPGTAPSKRPTTQHKHTTTSSPSLSFIAQSTSNNHGGKTSGKTAWGNPSRR